MSFCQKGGNFIDEGHEFCGKCGTPLVGPSIKLAEKAYFSDEGELVVKRTKHKGLGTKAASWLALGPIGYLAFGRD